MSQQFSASGNVSQDDTSVLEIGLNLPPRKFSFHSVVTCTKYELNESLSVAKSHELFEHRDFSSAATFENNLKRKHPRSNRGRVKAFSHKSGSVARLKGSVLYCPSEILGTARTMYMSDPRSFDKWV